ncbi:hypothetical protein AZE42_14104 [Rhizopogon vesiculosus]|uniref:Uncharacterized protein n=1 Tax=Rhizopogon vesiculosus TaxID=180088 RepID=A0A1J8PNX6_9AGAM|nr:hypothetical protein AZE42_14104 [Rhizopogon vesiculosus]
MFDHKLAMAYITGRIAESFKTDLCHVLGLPT